MSTRTEPWVQHNQQVLLSEIATVRTAVEYHSARVRGDMSGNDEAPHDTAPPPERPSSALDTLCRLFGLSPFERRVLLLCAGMELDADFASLCAAAHGDPGRGHPTLGLALGALPGAHWSALTPNATLRYWRLIEIGSGPTLTASPIRIDERVLHYLTGVQYLDERLAGLVMPEEVSHDLVPSHAALAERLVAIWEGRTGPAPPIVQLCGIEVEGKRAIASAACSALNLQLHIMQAEVVPAAPADLDVMLRLWMRESALDGAALLLDCDGVDPADSMRVQVVTALIERLQGPFILTSRDRWRTRRQVVVLDVNKPTRDEQRAMWQDSLGDIGPSLNGHVEALVTQFDLSTSSIQAASTSVLRTNGDSSIRQSIWDACRAQARPRLDDLAQRIEQGATWDDLVLPESQHQSLREIVAQVRERVTVYDRWGFRGKGSRGLGITALFAGSSGTGKTTAAEVLAGDLHLDLYRIDLSALVSKYIGETEKNLRRVFDAAEEGGAVLLFDEADALFGKRSEVKDSHDRYANIEVSYLLQRMEAYSGLAILTTNLRKALDTAFLRRIRFVVQFPFPDAPQRAEIWRRMFPRAMPAEGLNMERLAQLNVAGGSIRNIALHAAFLAAAAREPVRMEHLLQSAHREYAKLEKPLTGAETEGWECV